VKKWHCVPLSSTANDALVLPISQALFIESPFCKACKNPALKASPAPVISTTSKFGGTGLGLAISRHICEMMGGDIVVKGAIGQGATFTVSLPCRSK